MIARASILAALVLAACGPRTHEGAPPTVRVAPPSAAKAPASWDALCPSSGVGAARSIVAPGGDDLELEPSGAAVVGDRVALLGDKQASLWWWTPTASGGELARDPTWEARPLPAVDPRSCCVDPSHGSWGTAIKREKAGETCDAHRVARGSSVPWLKGEALAAAPDGTLYVGGNMGFDCVENEVRTIDRARGASVHVRGLDRPRVLAALGASDLRVEGLAVTRDGARDVALLGVRQVTAGPNPDSRDVTMTRKVIVAVREGGADELRIASVVDVAFDDPSLGLSDLAVLADGRVLVSVSVERTVSGEHQVGGVVLVTDADHPWRDRSAHTWPTHVVARFDDHKPEGLVALSATCAVVVFDDDEKVKRQKRERGGGPEWASRAAFVRFLRVP